MVHVLVCMHSIAIIMSPSLITWSASSTYMHLPRVFLYATWRHAHMIVLELHVNEGSKFLDRNHICKYCADTNSHVDVLQDVSIMLGVRCTQTVIALAFVSNMLPWPCQVLLLYMCHVYRCIDGITTKKSEVTPLGIYFTGKSYKRRVCLMLPKKNLGYWGSHVHLHFIMYMEIDRIPIECDCIRIFMNIFRIVYREGKKAFLISNT